MEDLVRFVRDSLAAGQRRDDIRGALDEAGWPADEVDDALGRFADVPFPVPVPRRRHSGSAREAFLYLVTFAALYSSAIAFGAILFGMVDYFLPDPVVSGYYAAGYAREGLRWNVATLIVSFPLFYLLTRHHFAAYVREPERRASPVRRWLTYLTLFVAACVVIGTLIGLIGSLLGGELLARNLLKILIAMGIAASAFGFYLWEMRTTERDGKR